MIFEKWNKCSWDEKIPDSNQFLIWNFQKSLEWLKEALSIETDNKTDDIMNEITFFRGKYVIISQI